MIQDPAKTPEFLEEVEEKLKGIPEVGETLPNIPVMIELVRDYIRKEYKEVPVKSIVAIVAALIYSLSLVNPIPDVLLGIGLLNESEIWEYF